MHCKPCEMCTVVEACAQARSETTTCPIEDATETDTIKIDYKEE